MNNLHPIDIAVIAGYLILCLIIGLYKAGSIKTMREYTLGSGRISTAVLLFTIFATYIGAGSTIGAVEKIHSMGLIYAFSLLFLPLFWVITIKIFSCNIEIFKNAGCISISDIMGFLYGKTGKWVTNTLSIFFAVAMISAQISAIGYLLNYFLGLSHFQGVSLAFGVLVIYSFFGGIRAVSLTDSFQGLVLLVAIPTACALALHEIGGYDVLIAKLPETHLSIDWTDANIMLVSGMIFYTLVPLSYGSFIQRYLMANDAKQLAKALRYAAVVSLLFALVICLIGFVMKVKVPDINPNTAFFHLIGSYLPIGITGLLITGILAAIMSTADSWLNTTSVVCAHDIAKGLFPKMTDRQELFIARIAVLIMSMLGMVLAFFGDSLMGTLWLAGNFWDTVILIPLSAGFLKFKTNQRSFIVSSVLGALGTMTAAYIVGEFATISMLFGTIGSAIGLFGMHYWQVATNQDVSNRRLAQYSNYEAITPRKRFNIIKFFSSLLKEQTTRYTQYAYILGALGMIYFLGSSFFMAFTDMKVLYSIVYMKAAAAILCFGLSIYELHLTPKQQTKYIPIYWNLVLLYCFPFLSAYIALVYNGSMPWMINLMLSTILL
ncbi:MAG: sodium:solute symporter, partial [Alphaproteobacteria bacterium]